MISQVLDNFVALNALSRDDPSDSRLKILTDFEKELPNIFLWWRAFCSYSADISVVTGVLQELEIPVWTSGLSCCRSELCLTAYKTLTASLDQVGQLNTEQISGIKAKFDIVSGKYCPPGCNCDNPWGFMG